MIKEKLEKKADLNNLTPKQKRVIELVVENGCQSKKEILGKAGYSKASQIKPIRVFNSKPVKKALEDHRQLFENEMREALIEAGKKRKTAKYRDLIDSTDKLKKHLNIIDNVDTGQTQNIIVLPSNLVQRRDDFIDGELLNETQDKITG